MVCPSLAFHSRTWGDVRSWYFLLRVFLFWFCFLMFLCGISTDISSFSCCFGVTVQCLMVLFFRWVDVIFVVGYNEMNV